MSALHGTRVVLGVTGGIAAYKAVEVSRRLVDAGAHVVPILTAGAEKFIGRVTFDALASEKVQTSLWDESSPIPHTTLGQTADLIIVAPATARLLSDYRTGRSDDLLTATLIATRAPVLVAPAMHTEMWEHAAVQDNISTLRDRGVHIVNPEAGRLAGGDLGFGRLAAPETIVAHAERVLSAGDLVGTHVVITAGGTREAIDPVRVISNRSTGKQGYALAEAAWARGARVTLISTVDRPDPVAVEVVQVASAAEMQLAVEAVNTADVIIMAAAVADFRPANPADQKIKKGDAATPAIELERTHDFLVDLGASKAEGQTIVGFAAETNDLVSNARGKLERKNLDLIVANDVSEPGAGFGHDTNKVTILGQNGAESDVAMSSKRVVADAILDAVVAIR
ncbi:MAG: bifunctional phosphopantothenoylcysteine decarboxylase/phosphopantothenate--cysteine ligase CoaBC [Acidimicrobiales bacterium]|nr:bifunctional phosphopantothenoylcysteine decarboxylase/phosphopantothenate--cysteine ligase CoaBC [Acidimicrobiales bacterium]RZV48738.1 MAG: bifunctional phosphopantothenoylcysteine decarboxylase/phosphopantothenate--cysteine ligase CoaBC [Acidimicrobiales bacterium]